MSISIMFAPNYRRAFCLEVLVQMLPNSGTDDGVLWPNLPPTFRTTWFCTVLAQTIKSESIQTSKRKRVE